MGQAWREAYNHPREIAKVAERFPALRAVVAHFAQPHLAACRELLLSYPNVHADISGLADANVTRVCGKEAIACSLAAVAEAQPGKILFGTDWPVCDAREQLLLIHSLRISETSKALILAGNAAKVFGLEGILL